MTPEWHDGDFGDVLHPIDVLELLQKLAAAGVIGMSALAVGAQGCGYLAAKDVKQVIFTGNQLAQRAIYHGDELICGPMPADLTSFIEALQDLHFRGGVVSDLHEPKPYDTDTANQHFTVSPRIQANRDYSMDTPIYFRCIPIRSSVFVEAVDNLIQRSFSTYEIVDLMDMLEPL
jgi:hypothetical protein